MPPLPIDGGTVEGRLEDLQGRFNVNNLILADGTTNPDAVKQDGELLRQTTTNARTGTSDNHNFICKTTHIRIPFG